MNLKEQRELLPEMLKVFESIPSLYLILSKELTVLTASDTFLQITAKNRKDIQGKYVFDIFPIDENIEDSVAIRTSLSKVVQTKLPDQLPIGRYDLPDPESSDKIKTHYWHSLNTPILDSSGEILYIIHSTRELTAQVTAEKELKISLEKQIQEASKAAQLSKRLEKLFADLPARIAILSGANFVYEYINPVYHQHFGYRDLIGKTFLEALPELAGHPIIAELKKVYETGVTFEGKEICIPLTNVEGEPPVDRYFNIMYQARLDEDGAVNGILTFAYDITELVNARKLEEEQYKKDEFLSIASHELKTPLTSIKAFNQLMQRTDDINKLKSFVLKSAGNILRLDKLIGDLLDVTKINAGKMQYNMHFFDFDEMLQQTIENVQHTAITHQIILEHHEPASFVGDRIRIEQVVSNFLTNAIKYSPGANRVIVNSRIKNEHIVVSIQDFGIGIDVQDMEHLFERYYRIHNSSMQFEGLGLGLFISSEILNRHNGEFWIESEPDQGSTFYFRLPINKKA
ncbi:ATP-binding protein [Pedobacter nyackensis]|uniref:ATP-binding protein n=1 Tax=Pedobacter nyackensis TaxID=475255 RepID=UPI0029315E15|nr:ATP-binding protein [Pedobacter nyackensis]